MWPVFCHVSPAPPSHLYIPVKLPPLGILLPQQNKKDTPWPTARLPFPSSRRRTKSPPCPNVLSMRLKPCESVYIHGTSSPPSRPQSPRPSGRRRGPKGSRSSPSLRRRLRRRQPLCPPAGRYSTQLRKRNARPGGQGDQRQMAQQIVRSRAAP